jgi:hypothetical protein
MYFKGKILEVPNHIQFTEKIQVDAFLQEF